MNAKLDEAEMGIKRSQTASQKQDEADATRQGSGTKPLTILLLTTKPWMQYSYNITQAACRYAERNRIRLVVRSTYVSDDPETVRAEEDDAVLMALACLKSKTIDGVLVISNLMDHYPNARLQERIFDRLYPYPVSSYGQEFPGIPCVVTENAAPMHDLALHLMDEHACRSFWHIRGPSETGEIQERTCGFLQALAERQIPEESVRTISGEYSFQHGKRSVEHMLEEQRPLPDAIVCACDEIAMGALKALREHDIQVPSDVRVTGYDDMEHYRYAGAGLTTVRQPQDEMVERALDLLCEQIGGHMPAFRSVVPSRLIRRTSCGCPKETVERTAAADEAPFAGTEPVDIMRATTGRFSEILRLMEGESIEQLIQTSLSVLPVLGITTLFLLQYEYEGAAPKRIPAEERRIPESMRVLFAYRDAAHCPELEQKTCRSGELLPDDLLRRLPRQPLLSPLFRNGMPLGLLVTDLSEQEANVHEFLRRQFSTARMTIDLVGGLRKANARLEAYSREQEEDRRTLEQALRSLRETQRQLVESEKMAALGNLVAGVAHEINTPLGVGISAATLAEGQLKILSEKYERGELERSGMDEFLEVSRESFEILVMNLRKAAGLVSSFKQVSVDQTMDEIRQFNLQEYIGTILQSMKPAFRKKSVDIELVCDPGITIRSYPGAISQILINLLMNAIVHAFPGDRKGHIRIEATLVGGRLELRFSDDGVGIPPENLGHIFEPFFTTNRSAGGTGLGLNIVYNLVVARLKGTIACESVPEQGTTFLISFPQMNAFG